MEKDKPNLEIRKREDEQKREEWIKRLLDYKEKVDIGELAKEDVPELIDVLFYQYREENNNSIRTELKNRLVELKSTIAEYYECREDEICI